MEAFASLFSLLGITVLPFWALMILAPRWRWTSRLVASPFIALGPILAYAALVTPRLATLMPALARPELPQIAALLGTPAGATIAWAHFLALDLLAGRAIFLDARARGVSPWLVSPVLWLTLMFAPLGLLAYAAVLAARAPAVRAATRAVVVGHAGLAALTAAALAMLAASLGLELFDGRVLGGASVWAKPAKFGAAIALAAPVLAWIIGQIEAPRLRRARAAGWVITVVTALEMLIIIVQSARGVPSHFNASTPLDGALFTIMGVAISIFWIAELVLAVATFRQPFADPARSWAIRLGLAGTLVGGAIGFVMPQPTPAQVAELRAGGHPAALGAHAVGVPDGGPGLPVTRWSTEGGDLRVPHFFGLHALQALPIAAALLARRRRRDARPVVAIGVAWLGLTLVLLIQALRAQPLIAPDAVTFAGAALALAAAGVVALWPQRKAALVEATSAV